MRSAGLHEPAAVADTDCVTPQSPPPGLSDADAAYVDSVLRRHGELARTEFRATPEGLELVAYLRRKGDTAAVAEQLELELAGSVACVLVREPGASLSPDPVEAPPRQHTTFPFRRLLALVTVLVVITIVGALAMKALRQLPSVPNAPPIALDNGSPVAIMQRDVDGVRYLLLSVGMLPSDHGTARFEVRLGVQRFGHPDGPVPAPMRVRAADGRTYTRIARRSSSPNRLDDVYAVPKAAAHDVWLELLDAHGGVRASMVLPVWVTG